MNKYNVGDVVKLRDDLEVGKEYGTEKLDEAMNDAIGKKAEIKDCYNDRYYAKFASRYGGCWFITDEMIEGLWEECNQVKKYNDHTLDAWRYAVESKLSEQVSKLKLIDVLNMIAKGELKEGTKVIFEDIELNFKNGDLEDEDGYSIACIMNNLKDLLSEVELIEPPCEHEWSKYSVGRLGRTENYRRCKKCGIHEEDIEPIDNTKIEELIADEINGKSYAEAISIIGSKLNEVIRMVNAITNLLN